MDAKTRTSTCCARSPPTHGAHLTELHDAEELGLEPERHVADLVEEQRPPVGLEEQAAARLHGARERAAHVAEELGLEQGLGDGGGVDGDERPRAAGPSRVDGAGDELFARARLAHDHGRRARGRDEVDGRLERAHGRALSDELDAGARGRGERRGPALGLCESPALLDRLDHDRAKLVEIAGLGHVLVRAALHRVDRPAHAARAGHEHDREPRVRALDAVEELEPAHAVHPDVAHDGVDRDALDDLERLLGVGGELARRAPRPRRRGRAIRVHLGVVVDDEEGRGCMRGAISRYPPA